MSQHHFALSILLIVALLAPGMTLAQPAAPQAAPAPQAQAGSILFVENAGQWPAAARFQVWGGPGTMWLANDAIWITLLDTPLPNPDSSGDELPSPLSFEERGEGPGERGEVLGVNLKLTFLGANPHSALEPSTPAETKVNYFLGSDPSQWRPEVPVWSSVRYDELYPGVDLVLGDGTSGAFPWQLEAQPGAASSLVQLRVEGADSLVLDGRLLRITTATGKLALPLPAAEFYFKVEATTTDGQLSIFDVAPGEGGVDGQNALDTPHHAPADNPAELLYGTFLGASYFEFSNAIALDSSGRAFVTGRTVSPGFPSTPGAFDPSYNGDSDAFVVRFNATGTALDYASFIGGRGYDYAVALALDTGGKATATGYTNSSDFPTTPNAFDKTFGGGTCGTPPNTAPCYDAFILRLNAAGSALDYSTFLGGSNADGSYAIAADSSGRASVTGGTESGNFPTTTGAYDRSYNGGGDAFIVRLNTAGSALDYATFLGSTDADAGTGLALDNSGRASVTGGTRSSGFPTTPNAFDKTFGGGTCGTPPNTYPCYDGFVVRLNAAGSALDYATFLGGSGSDGGGALVVDSSGRANVTGGTDSSDFPTTSGAFDRSYNGGGDVFVLRLNATGSALDHATFLGGSRYEYGAAVALDSGGRTTVTGWTESSDFSTTPNAFDQRLSGTDGFVAQLNAAGGALDYATFLGGGSQDFGRDIALDNSGRAMMTGLTASSDFPTTAGAYDRTHNGSSDAFVAKLAMSSAPPPTNTPTATPTPTNTPTATPTSTSTPTPTPLGPWAAWHAGKAPLLVPPNGVDAVVDYGNMATPVPLMAHVSGAALFGTGTVSGTTTINASLPTANGSYPLPLIPAIGATTGQTLTVRVDVGPVILTKNGWISQPAYLPLLLRH